MNEAFRQQFEKGIKELEDKIIEQIQIYNKNELPPPSTQNKWIIDPKRILKVSKNIQKNAEKYMFSSNTNREKYDLQPFEFIHVLEKALPKEIDYSFPKENISQINEVIETIDSLSPDLIKYLQNNHDDLTKINWKVFEQLIAEFLAFNRFKDVRLIGSDQRTSADIFALQYNKSINEYFKFYIEVKKTKEKIGINVINQVIGAYTIEKPKLGWNFALIYSIGGYSDFKKINVNQLSSLNLFLKDKNDISSDALKII